MAYAKWCLSFIAIIVICMTVSCGSVSSATGSSSTMSNSNVPVPFTQFLQSVTNARYSDYVHLATTRVQDEQAFEQMRLYILTLYAGVHVVNTYAVNEQPFDCIITSSKHGAPPVSIPPKKANPTSTGQSNSSNLASCKEGAVPMERVTLDRIAQFSTLQGFLSKSPGGSSLPPVPPLDGKK